METIKIAVTGDSFITQRLPRDDDGLLEIRDYLAGFDVRFTNFEVTVHNFDQSPSATSGGTWAAARPVVLKDLDWLGFNILACANNHCLDWLHGGLLSTITCLEKADWVFAGIGRNLAEASQPKYLETKAGRVALISVTSSFEKWHRAGEQRPDVPGRPGVNPLGHKKVHKVSSETLQLLKEIGATTEVNATRNLNVKEGFWKDETGPFILGDLYFEAGEPGTATFMDQADAARIEKTIREASRQADLVFVSLHAHEMKGMEKNKPADFLQEFSRFCIDHGANGVIGHGPHILRGIEVYKGKPIFYSLGDFIFQNDTVERQPAEFYDLYKLDHTHTPADGMDARSQHGTRGLAANPKVFESVVAAFEVSGGDIAEIELTPISLGFEKSRGGKGKPMFTDVEHGEKVLRELAELSSEFGTHITIKDGKGIIAL
ncbi:CapA family protein [Bacillus rubiinfantis]|uniref:CapA family protein n=1 Tax=Bacillus rubiinfantis TaxID=1499680 RepID=UPI0005A755A9|nr:CapA family protein [Bacillus rubiinfantis]